MALLAVPRFLRTCRHQSQQRALGAAVRFGGWQFHPLDIAHSENKILSSWENQFFGLSRLLCQKPLPNTIFVLRFYPNILGISCVDKREGKVIWGNRKALNKNDRPGVIRWDAFEVFRAVASVSLLRWLVVPLPYAYEWQCLVYLSVLHSLLDAFVL